MVANLGCQKYVFFSDEVGVDRGEDFRRYPKSDVE